MREGMGNLPVYGSLPSSIITSVEKVQEHDADVSVS